MIVGIVILWLLAGVISVWRFYHGMLRNFYEHCGLSMWKEKDGKEFFKKFFLTSCPIFILGGFISILAYWIAIPRGFNCWYFTTKNKYGKI